VGGSSITQQLIKNVTAEDSVTVQRKVQEFFRATLVEKNYDKEIIIEEYLNSIYLGQGSRGVKSAAEAYFGKELQMLTTAECASLISITNNPSLFDPYSTREFMYAGQMMNGMQRNRHRQLLVLGEMLNQGYITRDEYNEAVAQELVNNGAEVLAVDIDATNVNNAIETIPVCKCADVTKIEALKRLGISNIDVVIVAMASNLEASVMAVALCKEMGVKTVIVKCGNELHQKILSRVGADKVIFPEKESGIRLAKDLLSAGFSEMIELSEDVSMVEIDVKPDWIGKTLIDLSLRKKYSINVVAIRTGESITTTIDPSLPLEEGTSLIVIANTAKLKKLK
jgi:trk system potassium uptake protein TrkA